MNRHDANHAASRIQFTFHRRGRGGDPGEEPFESGNAGLLERNGESQELVQDVIDLLSKPRPERLSPAVRAQKPRKELERRP